jgi:hypothetical protein
MKCALCGCNRVSEAWFHHHDAQISEGGVRELIVTAKVSLPASVGYPKIVDEWYKPAPRVRSFACHDCGHVSQFVEFSEEIKAALDAVGEHT